MKRHGISFQPPPLPPPTPFTLPKKKWLSLGTTGPKILRL